VLHSSSLAEILKPLNLAVLFADESGKKIA
jgi:hypothetical protein